MLFYIGSFAQQKNYQKLVQISPVEFDKHLPEYTFIEKPMKRIKSQGIIRIKTAHKTIVLKDDGEFVEYRFEGYIKDTPLMLIHKLEPNTEEYYFVNKITGTIDTLLDKPIFYSNKQDIVCLEGSGTDVKQRIQVGRIQNGRFITKSIFTLRNDIAPEYVYWFNKNTIFIRGNGLWKLTF